MLMSGMYNGGIVALSFFIAFLGSYASISACEQFRLNKIGITYSQYVSSFSCLMLMAVSLGGIGMWCMHFVGMSAVSLLDAHGNHVEVRYDIGITLLSLALVIVFTLAGFYVSSHDIVFTKTKREIVDMFVEDSAAMSMKDVQKMKTFQMIFIIGTRAPQHLLLGGLITSSGVVVMHYLGMTAMRFQGHIVWNAGVIAGSVLIAFVASVAAFWILLRLLSIYPDQERLRLASAFTMAVAVCGMHYTGMNAAEFHFDPATSISVETTMSSHDAFLSGLLVTAVIFALVIVFVLADLRRSVLKMSTELYRADTFVKSIPPSNACSGNAAKYINKRKLNKFNLGVLNDTASLKDHEIHDDATSVASEDISPHTLKLMWAHFKAGRFLKRPLGAHAIGVAVVHDDSLSKVHPEDNCSLHSFDSQHTHQNHEHHHHHEENLHTTVDISSNNSVVSSELDGIVDAQITYKPGAFTLPGQIHAAAARYAYVDSTTLPPRSSKKQVGIADIHYENENDIEDIEKGLVSD